LPTKGYWFPPKFLTGVTHAHRVAGGKFRTAVERDDVPHAGGGVRAGELLHELADVGGARLL